MKNILIVESENDQFFFEAYIRHLQKSSTDIYVDNYELLKGSDQTKIEIVLDRIRSQVSRGELQINKIGVILDQDKETTSNRIQLVNDAIRGGFNLDEQVNLLDDTRQFKSIITTDVQLQIGCFFTNINGAGELETVLKAIKSELSIYADCLDSWQNCLKAHGINNGNGLKQKDFDKEWIRAYTRFDTCTKKEQKQAGTKCTTAAAMQKPIWNFDHECLNDFKGFLELFD
jgi:hypothetical protein